jgi:ATP-binding cassette subfamily F protein uup
MAEAQKIMAHLSLSGGPGGVQPDTPVSKLSGGWKKRVALARELLRQPDLLLLDEPTNHLDVDSILWLEEFLAQAKFATLTITHDRLFLQRISNRILELDRRNPGGLLSVQGDYATYLDTKQALMSAQETHETKLKNTLRRETEWLRRGAKARLTKQQARIDKHGVLKDQVEELNQRNRNSQVRIDFQSMEKNPKKLIEAKDRRLAGPTLPPQGLYLAEVFYTPELDNECKFL